MEGSPVSLSLSLSVQAPHLQSSSWNELPHWLPSPLAHSLAHHVFREQEWPGPDPRHLLGPQKHSSRPPNLGTVLPQPSAQV